MSVTRGLLLLVAGIVISSAACAAERDTLSLDGRWRIDESVSPTSVPTGFVRTVPVPGLQPVPPGSKQQRECAWPSNGPLTTALCGRHHDVAKRNATRLTTLQIDRAG